jgi:hypothetical protein
LASALSSQPRLFSASRSVDVSRIMAPNDRQKQGKDSELTPFRHGN